MASLKQINGKLEYVNDRGEVCSIEGELIADARLNPDYPVSKLFADFYETELGAEFLDVYDLDTIDPRTGLTNAKKIEQIFMKLYGHDPRMTLSRVADTIQTAIDAGALTPKPEESTATPSRTEDGRFATEHDLLRQEVRRLLADPSVSAQSIRQRADRDRAFGDAFRAEMAPVPATQPALSREEQVQEDATGELDSFVQSWKRLANPRFVGGYLQLDEHTRLTPAELDQWLNSAAKAGKL